MSIQRVRKSYDIQGLAHLWSVLYATRFIRHRKRNSVRDNLLTLKELFMRIFTIPVDGKKATLWTPLDHMRKFPEIEVGESFHVFAERKREDFSYVRSSVRGYIRRNSDGTVARKEFRCDRTTQAVPTNMKEYFLESPCMKVTRIK